jgi:hypothetical protein
MTPAINARLLADIDAAAARALALPDRLAATITTIDGRVISGGVMELDERSDRWRGRLQYLDRPGVVASMYFAEGIREVLVRLEDGRVAPAQIAGTSFVGTQRVCDLMGIDPLS